jgi:hypothetical protein
MADQIIKTRIGLKYDLLENWIKEENQFILKKGEVAFATVAASAGSGLTEPVVMAKIGDGNKSFNSLDWSFYAKASDVHTWAKKSETEFKAWIGEQLKIADYYTKSEVDALLKTITDAATALAERVTKLEGLYDSEKKLSVIIGELNTAIGTAKTDLIGASTDASSANTIYGAKKYAEEKAAAAITDANLGQYAKTADLGDLASLDTITHDKVSDFDTAVAAIKVADATHADAAAKVDNALTVKVGGVDVAFDGSAAQTADVDSAIATAIAPLATTEALNGVKEIAEAARTESEVNGQIDAKITALNLGGTYEPIGAENRAKGYVDQKFTDANLDQYTTEQEVKDIVDTVIANAVADDTLTGLTDLVEYLAEHGGEYDELLKTVNDHETRVDTLEAKPAYGITDTQISNWDGEVGAKALAEGLSTSKLDAATFTEYSNAHANDYDNAAIDGFVKDINDDIKGINDELDTFGDIVTHNAAEFKTKQTAYSNTGATTKTITAVSQNANGEIEVTYADIQISAENVEGIEVPSYELKEKYTAGSNENGHNGSVAFGLQKTLGEASEYVGTVDLNGHSGIELTLTSPSGTGLDSNDMSGSVYIGLDLATKTTIEGAVQSIVGGDCIESSKTGTTTFTVGVKDGTVTEAKLDATLAGKINAAAKDADLAAIAKSGNVADLIQTPGTYIIFDCGSATENV